jgi:hypothetical protein
MWQARADINLFVHRIRAAASRQPLNGRQQKPNKDRDDGNDDQQFDEGKTAVIERSPMKWR